MVKAPWCPHSSEWISNEGRARPTRHPFNMPPAAVAASAVAAAEADAATEAAATAEAAAAAATAAADRNKKSF